MRPRHPLRLGAAIPVERRPNASEGEQRPLIVEPKADHVLFLGLRARLRRVLGEAVERDKTSGSPASASRASAAMTCCGCW